MKLICMNEPYRKQIINLLGHIFVINHKYRQREIIMLMKEEFCVIYHIGLFIKYMSL